jgi:putative hydrolase of the HAD superfamily
MPAIEAVIFDLDDTLYSERAYAFSGFAAVAAAFEDVLGDPAEAAARMKALFDTEHRPRVFNALLAERGRPEDDELVARMIQAYRRHIPRIELYPDADAALRRLRSACKLGLISDGRMVTQALKLKALGLQARLDKTIVTSELGPGYEKPHPRAFEWMAESLGVDHARCAYVADNAAKDFIAPNALGWTTVQIVRPDGIYRDASPADAGTPRYTLDKLDDLEPVLQG